MGGLSRARLLWCLACLALVAGCRSWPGFPVVDEVVVAGTEDAETDPLLEGLATQETPLLFGVFPRVLEYALYDPGVLAKDLERIERWLRARGYYEAKVSAARVVHLDEHYVRVEIDVALGEPVRVRRVDPAGLALLPADVAGPAVAAIDMREGELFDEARFDEDKRALLKVLTDAGYAFAAVKAAGRVDIAAHAADVSYTVELGRRARFGPVRFEGLGEIPEGPVRDTLAIREGEQYSTADLDDGQKALVGLGAFSSVEILEDRSRPESALVPLTIRLRETKLRTLRLGGGVRFDVLRLSARLRAGWEDRNLLGGLRRFSIDATPGLTFFPTRLPTGGQPFYAPTRVLPESRLRAELRKPSFLERRTTGFTSAEYNVYPVLYPLPDDVDPVTEPILGYHELKYSVGLERTLFRHTLTVTPSYNLQGYYPFSYQGDAAGSLESVYVSFPELLTALDFRDDPVQTRRGVYLANSIQVAGYMFQGGVSDIRLRPEVRVYTQGALGKNSVFAARLAFGFLFPGDYGETLDASSEAGSEASQNPEDPDVVRDQQKLLLRAFFSGGPNSNRGYPLRGVGPHGPIGFLVPSNLSGVNCSLDDNSIENLPSGCIRPLGGLTLWELSMETRIPLSNSFNAVLFVDASDVTRETASIRLNVPHISPGIGFRYLTPVGPLRVDFGFRPPYLQQLGQKELDSDEGQAGDGFLGLPATLDIAIGEAF
jgi:outer membrane protein assembly factor BamA